MNGMEEWLASAETGEPFRHCIACRLPLLELDSPWLVNKESHAGEWIMEYAICGNCRDAVAASVPAETKARVRAFLHTEIDWSARIAGFFSDASGQSRFAGCVSCLAPRGELQGFVVSGMFDSGGVLVEGPLPVLVCSDCCRRIASLFCETTHRIWQDFLRQHMAGPADGGGIWW